MKFVAGERAVFIPEIESLVISDLHIGFDYELLKNGIIIPSQIDEMEKRIERLFKITKAKRLVILGDVKHKVPGMSWKEEKDLQNFFSKLVKKFEVHITLGNHDASLATVIGNLVKIHSSRGFKIGEYGFFHGHAWPSKLLLKCKSLFMGHTHPSVQLKDRFGYRLFIPVWVMLEMKKEVGSRYGVELSKDLSLIVVPAFNKLVGNCVLNVKEDEELLGPILKSEFVDLNKSKIFTLEGTELGSLEELRSI
ncbi:MAG TPA: metallophosphoesterase [Candidatus Aenigmarchaeota archaeon]|nr:metallophosphoesterase [Candidatus Aenigmarchaeota archaeon]